MDPVTCYAGSVTTRCDCSKIGEERMQYGRSESPKDVFVGIDLVGFFSVSAHARKPCFNDVGARYIEPDIRFSVVGLALLFR